MNKKYISGRSLVELMVAMVIGLIVIGSVWSIYLATSRTSSFSNVINRMNEDALIAMKIIGDQFKIAGFSIPRAIYSPNIINDGGVKKKNIDKNFNGAAVIGCDKGFVSHTVDSSNLTCKSISSNGTSAFSIKYEADEFQSLSFGGRPVDCLGSQLPLGGNAISDFDSTAYWLVENRFFISVDPRGTPNLSCAGNGNLFLSQPLIQNVEDMHITYGVADNIDVGAVKAYMSESEIISNGLTWEQVVSAKVCLVVRSESPILQDAMSIEGCRGEQLSSNDRFMRKVYKNTFSLRNKSEYLGAF